MLGRRESLESYTPMQFTQTYNVDSRWSLQASLGRHLATQETLAMRMGGMKDRVSLGSSYQLSRLDQITLELASERYRVQSGARVGSGNHAMLQYLHTYRSEAPTLQFGAFTSWHRYSRTDPALLQGRDAAILGYLPAFNDPTIDYLLPRSYHSGASEDLAEAIQHLRAKRPLAPLYAVGYSLGGNVLLKHLGETGSNSGVLGAVAVSVPFRLDQCADRIGQGFSRVYQAHFMREMVAYIKNKQRQFQHDGREDGLAKLAALGSLENMRTFWDFDGRITAPLHGFTDAEDYYRRASSRYYLGEIRTPTLIIQAADDPFVFPHSLPQADELSACTQFELQARGGHVGFVDGSFRRPGYYLERRIPQWLAALGQ